MSLLNAFGRRLWPARSDRRQSRNRKRLDPRAGILNRYSRHQFADREHQLGDRRLKARITDLDGRTTKALNGTSMTFAMTGVPWLDRTEHFAVSANWGTFQGANGVH
jgi:hypothetical protein